MKHGEPGEATKPGKAIKREDEEEASDSIVLKGNLACPVTIRGSELIGTLYWRTAAGNRREERNRNILKPDTDLLWQLARGPREAQAHPGGWITLKF